MVVLRDINPRGEARPVILIYFDDLDLTAPLLHAVEQEGYERPTEIQQLAIPHVLAGRDVLGCAQTGTGKTAAFALPIIQRLSVDRPDKDAPRPTRALVITPTRELASQIGESFSAYGRHAKLRNTVITGGVRQGPQNKALKKGVDILVATPGRLLDLMRQGRAILKHVEVFVLDEADRMLDMGFIDDIRTIIAAIPAKRQTLFFSATMPAKVQSLSNSILTDPVEIRVSPLQLAAETVDHMVYFVERPDKQALLAHLLEGDEIKRALIFTRTKRAADRVEQYLKNAGVCVDVIHADRPQQARERTMAKFKQGNTRVLVASDIASRGIDVDDISHVINFDIPEEAESYVHRIGRTGRAGATGRALSFCDIEERSHLDSIERLIGMPLIEVSEHPFRSPLPWSPKTRAKVRDSLKLRRMRRRRGPARPRRR